MSSEGETASGRNRGTPGSGGATSCDSARRAADLEETVNGGEILLYQNGAEKEVVNVVFHDENFWLTQKGMAELFGVKVPAISKLVQ